MGEHKHPNPHNKRPTPYKVILVHHRGFPSLAIKEAIKTFTKPEPKDSNSKDDLSKP